MCQSKSESCLILQLSKFVISTLPVNVMLQLMAPFRLQIVSGTIVVLLSLRSLMALKSHLFSRPLGLVRERLLKVHGSS